MVFVVGIFAAGGGSAAYAQEPGPSSAETVDGPITDDEFRLLLDEGSAAKVEDWIAQLGSPDYQRRQQATEGLIGIGAQALSKLRAAYHASDDLETRLRIEDIVRTAYLNYHVLDRHGFLGISMSFQTPDLREIPLLPADTVGVLVANVIADTGAARAGVERNDVIIGVDGRSLHGSGLAVREDLSATIRNHRPGTTIELTVVRNTRILTIEAIVARPAESIARTGSVLVVSDLYRQVAERFETWWVRYFRQPPSSSAEEQANEP